MNHKLLWSVATAGVLLLGFALNVDARRGADDGPGDDNGNDDGTNRCVEVTRADGTVNTGGDNSTRVQFHIFGVLRETNKWDGPLDLRDRATDQRLRSRKLTNYEIVDSTTRRLTFEWKIPARPSSR